jgi:hypothetical protein
MSQLGQTLKGWEKYGATAQMEKVWLDFFGWEFCTIHFRKLLKNVLFLSL